jgi:hypothetical protein
MQRVKQALREDNPNHRQTPTIRRAGCAQGLSSERECASTMAEAISATDIHAGYKLIAVAFPVQVFQTYR